MKISIITVSYNSSKTIERTIKSVLAQQNVDLEYIIKDGESKDSTLDIIKSYAERDSRIKYVSAPDKGIYDAMNIGVQMVTGDIVGILNSDDYYAASDLLYSILKIFNDKSDISLVYGNILYVKNSKPYRVWKSGKAKSFYSGWMPPHPALFVKKAVYEKYGLFRLDCGVNADYELMLRYFEVNKLPSYWLDEVVTYMEAGGRSNNNLQSRIEGLADNIQAWKVNNLKPKFYTIFLKKLRKLPQFVTAKFYKLTETKEIFK